MELQSVDVRMSNPCHGALLSIWVGDFSAAGNTQFKMHQQQRPFAAKMCSDILSGHFLFGEVNFLPRVKFKVNNELWGTENVQGHICLHIYMSMDTIVLSKYFCNTHSLKVSCHADVTYVPSSESLINRDIKQLEVDQQIPFL